MKNSKALLWAALFAGLTAALPRPILAGPPDDELRELDTEERGSLDLAGRLFEDGKYAAAAKQYRDFLHHYSRNDRAYEAQLMLAESLYRQALAEAGTTDAVSPKLLKEAHGEYRSAAGLIPKGDLLGETAAFRMAEIDFNLKSFDEAAKGFERVVGDFPGGTLRGEARLMQAQCLLAQNQPLAAVPLLRAVLKDQPFYQQEPRLDLTLGIALYEVNNSTEALLHLERLTTSPLAQLYAGMAWLRQGKPLVAVERLRQIPKLDAQNPLVSLSEYLVAESFFAASDYLPAMQAFENFLRTYALSPLRPGAMYKIGLSQFERGEALAARGSFQSVMQLAPKSEYAPLALYMTAESFFKENRLREAGFAYSDVASSYPDHALAPNAQLKLGWCSYKQEDFPAAEQALKLLLIKHPAHALAPRAALLLGNVLSRQNKYADAVRAYQRGLDMLQTNAPAASAKKEKELEDADRTELQEASLALLNRANLLAQDYGSLVSGYQFVLKDLKPSLHPWRAATLLAIAEGYFRQGSYDAAASIYREILGSFPVAPESAYAVDGLAWCLFKKGEYGKAEQERQRLAGYKSRPSVAASKTILLDGNLPESLYVENEFETATSRFNQKRFLDALDGYENFEKRHPEHALASEAGLQAGWCYYRLEYYGQAIKTWARVEQSYAQQPAAAKSAWAIADTYFRAGQYADAIATYQRILQTYNSDPALGHARLRIAQSHYNAKDVAKAIKAFENLIEETPDSPEAAQGLDFVTQLLYYRDSKSKAQEALTQIAERKPGTTAAAQARFRLAKTYYEAGEFETAAQALEGVVANLSLGTDLVDAQYFLAESYYNLKHYKEAALAYERLTANYPGDKRFVASLFHIGTSRFNLEEYAAAADAFGKVAQDYPASNYAPVALFNSALAYRKLGKWEEAARALKTYMDKFPDAAKNSNANAELVAIYEEHRQFPLATALLAQERSSLPDDDGKRLELTYRLAEDFAAMGDDEKAFAEYQRLAKSPLKGQAMRLSALAKLGEYYERKGDFNEALRAYQDLAKNATQQEWIEAANARVEALKEKVKSK